MCAGHALRLRFRFAPERSGGDALDIGANKNSHFSLLCVLKLPEWMIWNKRKTKKFARYKEWLKKRLAV